MNIRCEYCGRSYSELETNCPHCGAPNRAGAQSGRTVPRTIEELRAFCAAHRLPLEQMRFFIGENYRGARAFGIYKDANGVCTVYKNKADGSRAIRYQGTDEAYAVNEIYQKMKSEIQNQRRLQRQQPISRGAETMNQELARKKKKSSGVLPVFLAVFILLVVIYAAAAIARSPSNGYYRYKNDYYYYQNDNWYRYDKNLGEWIVRSIVDGALAENASDYYESSDWSSDYGIESFTQSDFYLESYGSGGSSSSSSYSSGSDSNWDTDWDDDWDDSDWDDSDWDWDSGDSWDSDVSDWDSDW